MGKAKRALTARLPANWRQMVWEQISESGSALRDAVAVLQLTGCRPAELHAGVSVEIEPDPDHGVLLVFTVRGAKVGQVPDRKGQLHDRGQPERHIAVPINSIAAKYLAGRLKIADKLLIRYHRKSISNRLSEISRKLFPRHREHLSAYCYRHAFGSSLKDTVSDSTVRAAALGHLTDYAQCKYGRPSRSGKGGIAPPIADAIASRRVKKNPKSDRLLQFKLATKKRKSNP